MPAFGDRNFNWWKSLSYRNESTELHSKSTDWFLYDRDLRHKEVNENVSAMNFVNNLRILELFFVLNISIATNFEIVSSGNVL